MPRYIHETSSSGLTTIDASVGFNVTPPGAVVLPSGNNIERASTTSETQVVTSSGLIVIASGEGQWSFASGTYDPSTGSGVAPTEIAGLVTWYDATESPATLTGSGVTSWNDLGTNGWHLDNNDGVPDKGDDGGVSGMLLNGVDDMFIPTNTGLAAAMGGNDEPYTVIVAYRQTDITNIGALYSFAASSDDVPNIFGIVRDKGSWQIFKRDSGSANSIGYIIGDSDSTIPSIASYTHTGTECSIFCSGVAQTAAASGMNTNAVTCGLAAFGGLNRFGFGKSNWWKGWFYSIACFDRELSSEERIAVEKNFAERYGVTMGTYERNQ